MRLPLSRTSTSRARCSVSRTRAKSRATKSSSPGRWAKSPPRSLSPSAPSRRRPAQEARNARYRNLGTRLLHGGALVVALRHGRLCPERLHRGDHCETNEPAATLYLNGNSTNLALQLFWGAWPGVPETLTSSPAIWRLNGPGPAFTSACVAAILILDGCSKITLSNSSHLVISYAVFCLKKK